MIVFIISCGLSILGAICALLTIKSDGISRTLGCTFGLGAAGCGLFAAGTSVFGDPQYLSWLSPWRFSDFTLLLNPWSGLILAVINFLGIMAWVYGYSYLKDYPGAKTGAIGFFMNMFMCAMNLVVATDSAFWFLIFFELMALTSYFLVIVSGTEQALHGGFMYFVMAHFGFILIMIAFFIMAAYTGSWSFADYRTFDFGPVASSFIFLLGFFGFGCKAGMFPTHSWLPQAHPEAPSNVSALMSGAMVKIGIYGMILIGLDLLQSSGVELWWGVVVLMFGALSSVLGVVYALNEHDVKKLLAYHTVENIGIILLGLGTGMIGLALDNPAVAALGLMAGCFHIINHASFKGLLFLGAGSLLYRTGTRNMDEMGGLIRLMPITALCFCVGSMAITAIPPLNGFASEWFTYQAMITGAGAGDWWITVFLGIAVVALALTGALAITCFVKAFGVSFLGQAHSEAAADAKEVPAPMIFSQVVLAAVCIGLGICASWIVPIMEGVGDSLGGAAIPMAANVIVFNESMDTALSLPLIAIIVLVLVFTGWALKRVVTRAGVSEGKQVWQTGYMPDGTMPLMAFSVSQEVRMFLKVFYTARDKIVGLVPVWNHFFKGVQDVFDKGQNVGDKTIVRGAVGLVDFLHLLVRKFENGRYQLYIVYIAAAFVVFVILACTL